MSIHDEDVQEFLKQNVKFLEDLQKQRVKLPPTLKNDREELLRRSNEWISSIPELEEEPDQFPGNEEETYDDDVGIYGEIGDDDDDDVTTTGEVQGEGAKILNLHASFKGWLKVEGFFHSSRWWGLIYSKGGPTNIVFLTITDLAMQQIFYHILINC